MSLPELATFLFAAFYGPLLVVVALAIYAWSLPPAARGASWLQRRARSPLFWVVVPPLVAVTIVAGLYQFGRSEAVGLSSGPNVTLTKTTTTHFTVAGSTLSSYVDPSGDQLRLVASRPPSGVLTLGPQMPFVTGDGAHAIEAPTGEFLILHGQLQTASSILSPISGTALQGPTFPGPISLGAFSIARGVVGTFLVIGGGDTVAGGQPLKTYIVTPALTAGGAWAVAAGPNLTGTQGAGEGAHAIKLTAGGVTRFLIVHAGNGIAGSADTSIYDPTLNTMVAGPALPGAFKAGKGALAVPRNDGTFLVVLGSNKNDTQIYTPPTDATGIGSWSTGPVMNGPVNDGSFAIQYKNAASQDRFIILRGQTAKGDVYDPAAAANAGIVSPSLDVSVSGGATKLASGAFGYQRADGKVVGFAAGQTTGAFLFDPASGTNGGFSAITLTNNLVYDIGSFALQQRDGQFLLFAGSSAETRLNDAGWAFNATYESEPINPGNVDRWNQIAWTFAAVTPDITLQWRSSNAKDLLANATYATVTTSTQTGSVAISPPVADKWVQVKVTMKQAGTAQTGAQESVWLGSDSVVQRRGLTGTPPVLSDLSLRYTTGVFVLSARSPETAGVGFPLTVELRDSADKRLVDYTGNHTLVFTGASTAPDGVTRPTVKDRGNTAVAFGQPTALTFDASGLTVGTSAPRTFLYKKEEIDLSATETTTAPGPFLGFDVTAATMTTGLAAHVLVLANTPSATKSTITAAPSAVKPDGAATSTLTVTVRDAFENILPGFQVTLASDRPSLDTFSRTTLPPTDFKGQTTATVSSTTRGFSNVTATVQGPPTVASVPQRFFGITTTPFLRAGPVGSTLFQAPTTVPGSAALTSTMDFGTATGSRQVVPGSTNGAAGSPSASATNKGWRDESYARAAQATTASQLTGDWTFAYSLALTTGSTPVTGQMTVVVYAVNASNSTRELFRSTSGDLPIGRAELNHTQTFTPTYAVLDGVAGKIAAGEILQYELFLNLSQNGNGAPGAVVQFRAGSAGTNLNAPSIEAGSISDLPGTIALTAITPAARVNFQGAAAIVTLTKSTQAHFAAGTAGTGVTSSSAGIALAGTPATLVTTASLGPSVGEGGHTLQGSGGEFLIVHGNGGTATTIYSPPGVASNGPAFSSPIGKGAFAFPISGGYYVVVAGGGTDIGAQPLRTYVVTPPTAPGGSWTIGGGPPLAGATGAGLGAHAVKFTVSGTSKFLIVHGDGTGKTSVYSTATGLIVAGPDLVIPATGLPGLPLGAAGAGAHAIPRTDAKYLVVLGNGTTGANVYDPTSGGDGSFVGGPTIGAAVGAGGHAIQYKNGSGQARALVVAGNGSTATAIYDPGAVVDAGISAGPTLPTAVTTGGHSLLRGNGTVLVLSGGGTSAAAFTPSAETVAAATITSLPSIGAGAHAFQRFDGQFVIVAGGGTALATYDAGWPLTGTYETEALNPANVDHWDRVSWTKSAEGTVTVSTRTVACQDTPAACATALAGISYTNIALAQAASGSAAINGAVGSRWVQVKLALARTVPASTDAEAGVWLGSSSLVQDRSRGGPLVTLIGLDYLSASFAITAGATQAAGAANAATIRLVDSASTVVTDYTGSHTLVFAGANTAPDGTSAPTATNASAASVAFGTGTALAFTAGTATTTLRLYKAESAAVTVSETVTAPGPSTAYALTTHTMDMSTPSTIVVTAAAPNAATSTVTPSPASVPADNVTTSAITVRVKDQYQNPVSGATVTLATDRASFDTLVNPAATDAAGLGAGSARSTRFGTSTITATATTALGSAIVTQTASVVFGAATFTVTTENAGTQTAGVAFRLTLTAKDLSGTTVTAYTGTKTIVFKTTATARTSPAAGPAPVVTTPQTVTFAAGVATTSTGTGAACGAPVTTPATPCTFSLYNSAQKPTISATEGAFPTGVSTPITIVPATASMTVSTLSADPPTVTADNKDSAAITVRVMDAFGNPISGANVTYVSSRNPDTIIQPNATDADGLGLGQITSNTTGNATVSAEVRVGGNLIGTLTQTVPINFVNIGGATRVLVIRTQNIEKETAGAAFSLKVIGIKADGTTDTQYCNAASCTVTITNTAQAAPDGTAPTGTVVVTGNNIFTQGVFETSVGTSSFITFFRADQVPLPTITVSVQKGAETIIGNTPAITVAPGAVQLTKSYVYAVPSLAPADGTTAVTLGAKVVDNFRNAISGKTVTFSSSRGVTDTIVQPAASTGALGLAFGSVRSGTAGTATITGTVTATTLTSPAAPGATSLAVASTSGIQVGGVVTLKSGANEANVTVATVPNATTLTLTAPLGGAFTYPSGAAVTSAMTSAAATVEFFGSPGGGRVQNGTRPGVVVNGTPTDVPLGLVARDLAGLDLAPDTIISWSVRGAGDGTFTTTATTSATTLTSPAAPGATSLAVASTSGIQVGGVVTLKSGANEANVTVATVPNATTLTLTAPLGGAFTYPSGAAVSTPAHLTQFTARRAGTVTISAGYTIPSGKTGAGTQVTVDITFKIVSQFDVKATTTEGKVVTARVEWDGTTLRTLSWVTTGP